MRLRPPATPLITIDPHFSVWSDSDVLNSKNTVHWTTKEQNIRGYLTVDGVDYRFIGAEKTEGEPALTQISSDMDALTSTYVFEGAGIELTALFTSPLLPYDYYYLSRPVSYLELAVRSIDGEEHDVSARISVPEQICLDKAGDDEVVTEIIERDGLAHAKMGSKSQNMLARNGDYLTIEWGYFYLSAANAVAESRVEDGMTWVTVKADVDTSALFTFSSPNSSFNICCIFGIRELPPTSNTSRICRVDKFFFFIALFTISNVFLNNSLLHCSNSSRDNWNT